MFPTGSDISVRVNGCGTGLGWQWVYINLPNIPISALL